MTQVYVLRRGCNVVEASPLTCDRRPARSTFDLASFLPRTRHSGTTNRGTPMAQVLCLMERKSQYVLARASRFGAGGHKQGRHYVLSVAIG